MIWFIIALLGWLGQIMNKTLSKIIVILGPTASGKTDLGVVLAKKFGGEVVSADSRQIYRKMDIATAKPLLDPSFIRRENEAVYLVDGVPHYMLDIVDPGEGFSLAEYKRRAIECIYDILERGKLPIIVGGTGLYIWAIVDNLDIPQVAPNKKMRKGFEEKNLDELVELLKKLDPEGAKGVDLQNPRRVIRALEVVVTTGESFVKQRKKAEPLFDALQIGIKLLKEEIFRRIDARCDEQIKKGLIAETEALVKQSYGWNLPSMSGIGYKEIGMYLRGELTLTEAIELFKRNTRNYAKRQMTWFKRDERIRWIEGWDMKKTEKLVSEYLGFKPQILK
ncbi:MAG: tRNA dimethylallyltransferase [Candidatus Magasanikbacteria bacterium GW2011_GWA2_46_17]|uniref:tRNA dimethylallyltransferase n=1 Tax=Candidatus Magasanikbacteria bacterium GW2011_GWA2_46_17 TaxID=1619042 RepID=A0A0G1P3K9_9BACT|nr:MAG: tRNA dimethylallyltransferase [Candidatus Magasanikbacteria bacterium GW2011_GWA2_46_17]